VPIHPYISSHLLKSFLEPDGDGLSPRPGGVGFIYVFEGGGGTKGHALRLAVAQIAFDDTALLRFINDRPEGAGQGAHPAADALRLIPGDPAGDRLVMHGGGGTDRHAGRVFALLAYGRHGKPLHLPGKDLDPGGVGPKLAVMVEGA